MYAGFNSDKGGFAVFRKQIMMLVVISVYFPYTWAENSTSVPSKSIQLAKIDTNNDGQISKEELYQREPLLKYWDKLDTNRDGYLTVAEMARLQAVISREEARKTGHPVDVQQYQNGTYISPSEQIERNNP